MPGNSDDRLNGIPNSDSDNMPDSSILNDEDSIPEVGVYEAAMRS